jgi:hypothetical protein
MSAFAAMRRSLPTEGKTMKILQCKSGPHGPETFDNDCAPLTDAEKLAKYGKAGVARQPARSAKLKAQVDEIRAYRGNLK